jgi:hypothetical protein
VTNISNGLFIVVIVDPVEGERIVETLIEADLILVDCHCEFAVLAREYPLKLAVGVKLIQYNRPLEEGREELAEEEAQVPGSSPRVKFALSGTKLKSRVTDISLRLSLKAYFVTANRIRRCYNKQRSTQA